MSLAGRTALVTGGGRGIGRAIAERLAREGARVMVAGRSVRDGGDPQTLEPGGEASRLGERPKPPPESLQLDVADRASIARAVAELAARGTRIDILVNNAGAAESAPFDRTSDELWDRMLAVNVTGAFALSRALLPAMIAAGWGRVVNVASNAGITGYPYTSAYCASKHALVGLTRALAVEVARTGVTVNAVCPGFVNTRLADEAVDRITTTTGRSAADARRSLEAMSPQRRLVEAPEVAEVVAMLCNEAARSVNGQAIPIDGGQVMS